jgi:quercetin dioxygenase-like cupin family protein
MSKGLATYKTYDGSEYTVLERPSAPGGPLVMRFRLTPDCGVPPPHIHPRTVEVFEVREGELELLVERQWQTARAGDTMKLEPDVRHTFRNGSGPEVVVRNVHDPHHDFEAYIRAVAKISQQLRATDAKSPGAAARMAVLWGRHGD